MLNPFFINVCLAILDDSNSYKANGPFHELYSKLSGTVKWTFIRVKPKCSILKAWLPPPFSFAIHD